MTSPQDVPPLKPPPSFSPATSILPSKSRYTETFPQSPVLNSLAESSFEHSSIPDLHSASTSDLISRTSSPERRLSRSTIRLSRSSTASPLGTRIDAIDDIRSIIIRSFSPVISVCTSPETDNFIRRKGFRGGFLELIRPFGERIAGKVLIRDGVGSSRSWDDFGVRFEQLCCHDSVNQKREGDSQALHDLERILEKHLESEAQPLGGWLPSGDSTAKGPPPPSPLYKLFLRRMLSSFSPSPHETIMHPVASVIVINSRTPTPLEALRQLYSRTIQGDKRPPPWMHPEYLRYYVLVHDEDNDDITKSTALFDQMKRHFGLHCHLLRLRSNQCVVTDDDSTVFPSPEWLSSRQDLMTLENQEPLIDVDNDFTYVFESDVTALRSLVRELVAQSVIPHMENRVALWNDQVASRRRGLSGRFMSISKRWAGFGSGSRSSGSPFGGSSGNYDSHHGFYPPDTPEALLRKLGDYSFMLRDWKLASSTYDLLRADFANDNAWKYHAGAHEMCAIATLLNPLSSTSKSKLEPIEQLLETACYSYLTRCSDHQHALRTAILGAELLKSRGGPGAESAARWSTKVLEMGLLGNIGRLLLYERVSACFASKTATIGTHWGTRRRKAGMWALFAAEGWLRQGYPQLASNSMEEVDRLYSDNTQAGVLPLPEMQQVIEELRLSIKVGCLDIRGMNGEGDETPPDTAVDEAPEKLDYRRHGHRPSLMGGVNSLEGIPNLRPMETNESPERSDDFE